MVTTRNHPSDFKESLSSPSQDSARKRTTRTSTSTPNRSSSPPTPTKTTTRTYTSWASSARASHKHGWSHTPSNLTLLWLAISLPLVVWDTGYVLLRPYSMPGGKLHSPIWTPYALYGTIDHVYGFKAYNARSGWTAAQGAINALETIAYCAYLYLVYKFGEQETTQGRGAPDKKALGPLGALGESRTVYGRMAACVVLLGYSTASITFWKTILYWLNEAFSGFAGVGHNDWATLFFLWIIPNGAWLVFPAYMIYVYGMEIVQGLEIATESRRYR